MQPDSEIRSVNDRNANTFLSIPKVEEGMGGTPKSPSEEASDLSHDNAVEDGYPALAAYHGSEDRNLVFRKFSSLQARLILEKQDEIRLLEEQIQQYDSDCKAKDIHGQSPRRIETRYRRNNAEASNRSEFFDRVERKFLEYAHRLATLERPVKYEYKNVYRYIHQTKPVTAPESTYIDEPRDLITLRRPGAHAHIGGVVELALNRIKQATQRNGRNVTLQKWVQENVKSERLAGLFIAGVTFMIVPPLFVVPIYALSKVGDNIGKSIGILVAFAVTFTGLLLVGTPAKQHEILSSSAA
ncbi:MAG: hypothetical protein Q9165_005994 [Trypethelium subeluteriae]